MGGILTSCDLRGVYFLRAPTRRCAAYEQRLLGQMGIDKKTLRFAVGRTGDPQDPHADLIMNENESPTSDG